MKAAANTNKSAKAVATKTQQQRDRRSDRGIPIDEMRRLMSVYGPIKSLRKRQQKKGTGGGGVTGDNNMKVDSVKRKFYRWFPDLDERFEKGEDGKYNPKGGHHAELRYREKMRAAEWKNITGKRAKRRRETKLGGGEDGREARAQKVRRPGSAGTTTTSSLMEGEVNIKVDVVHDPTAAMTDDGCGDDLSLCGCHSDEEFDLSFVAEQGIFDDIEEHFYSSAAYTPRVVSRTISASASSWEDQGSSVQSSGHESLSSADSILNMMGVTGESFEECCSEILKDDLFGSAL